jgi:hypothetical protein
VHDDTLAQSLSTGAAFQLSPEPLIAARRRTGFFYVGDRLSLTPRFSEVAGKPRARGTVSTVSPTRALETVKTV